ncbi:HET-domain-containing protein [Trematosphaeria pertusa]|uniref:HET-domain-containing protein n=1 Tax=Trematosphaeria pertusa TaxID=390896 RepID=A0A6A6IEZ5_9PLEO|nr:HET-domain-containing protein [Trematosphaeria pertusa]KAF2248472.1 HET-domain-containing protein [Trematosphaeria pertusa]
MRTHTCEYCQRLVLKIPEAPTDFDELDARNTTASVWDLNDIECAAQAGCPLFLALVNKYTEGGRTLQSLLPTPILYKHWLYREENKWDLWMQLHPQAEPMTKSYAPIGSSYVFYEPFLLEADGYKHVGNCNSHVPGRRRINLRPGAPESFLLARSWIEECIAQHNHEPGGEPTTAPLRLVWLRKRPGTYDLQLVEPPGNANGSSCFVALSYCWGGDQRHKTTKARLRASGGRLLFHELPRTIQDAIKITAGLGYEFIWIDSLCIVQDDALEAQREIAKMPHIYSRAIVTIAAATAASASEGFLHERCADDTVITGIRLQHSDGSTRMVGLVNRAEDDPAELKLMPLEARGWALQERILSTRILQYHPRQLRFICQTTSSGGSPYYTDGWDWLPDEGLLNIPRFPLPSAPRDEIERYWERIVELYSNRKLTVDADRVLAISGIAARLGQLLGRHMKYVAGHWLYMLPRDLLWSTQDPEPTIPDVWLGPSWSWTSVKCRVDYEWVPEEEEVNCGQYRLTWEVLGVDAELVDEQAPFGALKKGILRMKAPILRVHLRGDTVLSWADGLSLLRNSELRTPDGLDVQRYIDTYQLEIRMDTELYYKEPAETVYFNSWLQVHANIQHMAFPTQGPYAQTGRARKSRECEAV